MMKAAMAAEANRRLKANHAASSRNCAKRAPSSRRRYGFSAGQYYAMAIMLERGAKSAAWTAAAAYER
jgi:hypothetical protein